MRPAIFLDRDGTINSDEGHYYIFRPEDFRFNPGAIEAIRRFNEAGYLVIVITNQGGVARGLYTEKDVEAVHRYMQQELQARGARVDAVYYCPHHPDVAPCECRKPAPGMLLRATREWDVDPASSVMIGDGERDMEAARAAGIAGIRVPKNGDLGAVAERVLAHPFGTPFLTRKP